MEGPKEEVNEPKDEVVVERLRKKHLGQWTFQSLRKLKAETFTSDLLTDDGIYQVHESMFCGCYCRFGQLQRKSAERWVLEHGDDVQVMH